MNEYLIPAIVLVKIVLIIAYRHWRASTRANKPAHALSKSRESGSFPHEQFNSAHAERSREAIKLRDTQQDAELLASDAARRQPPALAPDTKLV